MASEMAAAFLAALPQILKLLRKHPEPFVATVNRMGSVRLMFD